MLDEGPKSIAYVNFRGGAVSLNLFNPVRNAMKTEAEFIAHKDDVVAFVDDVLRRYGFARARASLDLIVSLKGDSVRRDSMPSILHEISQACYTIGLIDRGLLSPADPLTHRLLCINMLHDTGEEFGERVCGPFTDNEGCRDRYATWLMQKWRSHSALASGDEDRQTASLAWRMSKTYGKTRLYTLTGDYYAVLGEDPATVIGKCEDRVHNNATLLGSEITDGRVKSYCTETKTFYPTLLENARQAFPAYSAIFDFFDDLIRRQVRLTERLIDPDCRNAGTGDMFAINDSFSLPHGINPVSMIVARAKQPAREPCRTVRPPQQALACSG